MPNWCANRVSVNGSIEEIKRFKEFVQSEYEPFSFDSILPMPKELRSVQSPITIKTQGEIDEYIKEHGDKSWMLQTLPITQERYDSLMQTYGYASWYDWANGRWGTKWNVLEATLEDYSNDGELQYTFETAWGPPEGIHSILVEEFPDLFITWFWDEPGMEIAGYL